MKRALPIGLAVLLLAGVVAASAGGPGYWRAFLRGDVAPPSDSTSALVIAGGDGASIPPASPEAQGLDAGSLDVARDTAQSLGARAFAVARRGHLVSSWSAEGDDSLVRSPLLSRLVHAASDAARVEPALPASDVAPPAAGSLRNPWSIRSRLRYGAARGDPAFDIAAWASAFSRDLWKPLQARDARIELDANGIPRLQCCVWLRARDALALATALTGGGQIDGERLMEAEPAARVLQAMDDGVPPRGAEPFGTRPVRLWRDSEGSRLYSFPAQELVILLVRADEGRLADETAIAHQVLRGIVDRPLAPAAAPSPRELVPAH